MSKPQITPRVLKGFRDSLPTTCIPREAMITQLQQVFSSFGFAPIDTPALEYAEILLGKGSDETDRQLYRFQDKGGRDVAMRFDLTIPLARYVAMHIGKFGTPFRRYHIAPVWRAEKPQKGRYREFIQCDFDMIGPTSAYADAEIVAVIHSSMAALKVKHQIRINNRSILNGLLETLGAEDRAVPVLRAIDKLDKAGKAAVEAELAEAANLDSQQIKQVFSFLDISASKLSATDLVAALRESLSSNEKIEHGVTRLDELISLLEAFSIPADSYSIDLTIARGLDYYTGTVFETICSDLPEIGSVCSGGRYDDLASLYTKQHLPGVGASIGLDRLMAALEELGQLDERSSPAEILVAVQNEEERNHMVRVGTKLRSAGYAVEVFPETKKLGNLFKFADKRGIKFVAFGLAGDEVSGCFKLKHLDSGNEMENISLKKNSDSIAAWIEQQLKS